MHTDVTVLGSANLDLFLAVERYPAGGETVTAEHRGEAAGGKGLNQAVAAARSGAATAFTGAVGRDAHAGTLLATLSGEGVDTTAVRRSPAPTGTATILVQPSGENTILVVPGANGDAVVGPDTRAAIRRSAVLVVQLEIPLDTVADGVAVARDAGTTVVLNAAPAVPLAPEVLAAVDVLVVNEHEATLLGGDDPLRAAARLCRGGRHVVVTLGADGAAVVDSAGRVERHPGFPAAVVDTTGAGDTFVGVLAASLAGGGTLAEAVRRGVAAGAVAVERPGAAPSIPTRDEIDARLDAG
ncbi:ribokinase [Myceligenerans cantabricum]